MESIAFYQLESRGMAVQDRMTAHFKALFVSSSLKKGKRPFKPEKFLTFRENKKGGKPAPDDLDEDW